MKDTVHLIGAEDVYRGGTMIREAANTIAGAANTLSDVSERLMRCMDSQLDRFECLIERMEKIRLVEPPDGKNQT